MLDFVFSLLYCFLHRTTGARERQMPITPTDLILACAGAAALGSLGTLLALWRLEGADLDRS